MTPLETLAWVLATGMILPLSAFSLELTAGLAPPHRKEKAAAHPDLAVLIPAHNEELGLAQTISALYAVAPDDIRIVVVADNCTDGTAAVARSAGAETVERTDPGARGKGYALACGRDYLGKNCPPECIVILDADCRLSPGSLEVLARSVREMRRPAQAINLTSAEPDADPLVQISSFAMVVKNRIRSRGMQRLGGVALLTGTGMAFPWCLFAEAKLATGSIVEDLALGIEMTRSGRPPVLVEDALVTSAAAHRDDALEQRTRWEHGFLKSLIRNAMPTLWSGVTRRSRAEFALGLHLLIPPLALLIVVAATVLIALACMSKFGAGILPALTLGWVLLCSLTLIVFCWITQGRAYLSAGAALRAPIYILWKLPIYVRFLHRPSTQWKRTPRR